MKTKNTILRKTILSLPGKIFLLKIILVPLFWSQLIISQVEFEKIYGSSGHDFGNHCIQTMDGGFLIAGSTDSYGAGNTDGYLIKIDKYGDTLWTKTFGGTGYDYFFSVEQTVDGGYLAGGYTTSFGFGSDDFYVVKVDSSGNFIWSRAYGGTSVDDMVKLVTTGDGGCLLAGWTGSFGFGNADNYLVRIDASGDTLWSRTFGTSISESLNFASATSDEGFLLAGTVYDNQTFDNDIYLLKINSNGNTDWVQSIGRTPPETIADIGYAAIQTSDNGFLILGQTQLGAGDNCTVLIKLDPSGTNIEWSRQYGGISTERGLDVKQTSDSGFVVIGSTFSTGNGYSDNFIFKTDKIGNLLWTKSFGYIYDNDEARSICTTSDGGFFLAGYATGLVGFPSPDIFVIKTDSQGESCNKIPISFTSDTIGMAIANEFTQTTRQCFVSIPPTLIGSGTKVTTFCSTVDVSSDNSSVEKFLLDQNYPNPFNPATTIQFSIPEETFVKLEIYNSIGEKVSTLIFENLRAGNYKHYWDAGGYSTGIYFYKITATPNGGQAGSFTETKKMILLK